VAREPGFARLYENMVCEHIIRGNTPDLYLVGIRFESQVGHGLSYGFLWFVSLHPGEFRVSRTTFRLMTGCFLYRIIHPQPLLHNLQTIRHRCLELLSTKYDSRTLYRATQPTVTLFLYMKLISVLIKEC